MRFETPAPLSGGTRYRVALLSVLTLIGCGPDRFQKQPDELLVGILDDPVFYQTRNADGQEDGFEFDVLAQFAESQHKKLRVVSAGNPEKLRKLLDNEQIDFVAGLPVLNDPSVLYTTPLREAKPLIVQNADALPVFEPAALSGRVVEVLPGTVQDASVRALSVSPPPVIQYPLATNGVDLLQRLSEFRSELAATDSIHFAYAAIYFPDLIVAQELPGKIAFAWGFRATDGEMRDAASTFIDAAHASGQLAQLIDLHFGHLKRFNPLGATEFIDDMRTRLPRFRQAFVDAQAETGIDWRLLAALAYQESKWNPLATSYTGVRGMMMITEETADRLGVKNRLDAYESIRAGSRYLAELKDRLSDKIPDPDRLWMALAAYNLGFGHLNGARQVAVTMKRDPNSWYEMKRVLPLMARPEYYARLKAGKARGGEAVILVENVRAYYDILVRFDSHRRSPLQPELKLKMK